MIETRFFKSWLGFRSGDWVEVKTAEEILATLDSQGCLDALPFMPEMLQYCGKRFRVFKSAHKTCDTIHTHKNREMKNAVHLEELRCDGTAHEGCQAGCLLFWKQSWLKPLSVCESNSKFIHTSSKSNDSVRDRSTLCDRLALNRATRVSSVSGQGVPVRYRCQATEIFHATTPLQWWNPWPYLKDLFLRNIRLRDFIHYMTIAVFNVIMRLHWRLRPYPFVCGTAGLRTPSVRLNVQPGELVRVQSKEEIMRTLIEGGNRNRGLSFDVEMVQFCSKTFPVLRRVERIIDEKTGQMMRLPSDCIILDGVTCSGYFSRNRLFCPRSIYPYWREIWLKRVDGKGTGGASTADGNLVKRPRNYQTPQ